MYIFLPTVRVVLQFEGEAVNNELSGDRLATLIMDYPNRLNAEVAAVSTGEECVTVAISVHLFLLSFVMMHTHEQHTLFQ